MLAISGNARIFLFQKPIDMRKGIESLSVLVEENFAGELLSGAYFVFINRVKDSIKDKLVNGKILPKSKFKEALGYFCGLIPHLKNYTQHAWARLDNNVAERAVRPLAIGRKNWLFVGNEAGGEAAATILTLVQSCRALGVNPREYLEDVMRRLMSHNSKRLHELLPDQWLQARQ